MVQYPVLGRALAVALVLAWIATPVEARSLTEIAEGPDVCMVAPSLVPPVAPLVAEPDEVLADLAKAGPALAARDRARAGARMDARELRREHRRDDRVRARLPHRCRPGVDRLSTRRSSSRSRASTRCSSRRCRRARSTARSRGRRCDALVAGRARRTSTSRCRTKRLVAVGHSGAYRTLALWLANERLDTVVLLDAVYGEYSFIPWVRESQSHRLVNIVFETDRFSDYMHRGLPSTVRVDRAARGRVPRGAHPLCEDRPSATTRSSPMAWRCRWRCARSTCRRCRARGSTSGSGCRSAAIRSRRPSGSPRTDAQLRDFLRPPRRARLVGS